MALDDIDVIIRVAGATLLLWAAFGGGRVRQGARRFLIPFALCLAGFMAGNTPDPDLRLAGAAGRVAIILAGYAALFLWWWCLAVFDRGFRPRGLVLAVGVAWAAVASADRGMFGASLESRGLSWILVGLGLAMVGHLAWRLMADRAGDLIDRRRRARSLVVGLLASQLLADLLVDLTLGFDWGPQAFSITQNAALLAFTGWLLTLDMREAPVSTDVPSQRSARFSPDQAPDDALAARLQILLDVERLHLDSDLTFDGFVTAMGAPERTVRHFINKQLGHDHFRTFLNVHRVEEARRRLSDPGHRADKLIAIALDSGFGSLPSFNRAFREIQGCAPSAYRAAAQPPSEQRSAEF